MAGAWSPATWQSNTDINLLPQGLISNIDVVTGGASAAYGSDAVAGVTNFTLNTRFEGLRAEANYGASSHGGDGDSHASPWPGARPSSTASCT